MEWHIEEGFYAKTSSDPCYQRKKVQKRKYSVKTTKKCNDQQMYLFMDNMLSKVKKQEPLF